MLTSLKAIWKILWMRAAFFGIVTFLIILIAGYEVKPEWSDFQDKKWWDWLDLAVIPFALGIGIALVNHAIQRTEKQRAEQAAELERQRNEQQAEREHQRALNQTMDTILQSYLDDMTNLLLKENLREALIAWKPEQERLPDDALSNPGMMPEVVVVARARTVTALRSLDVLYRNMMITFLSEAGLVTGENGNLLVNINLENIDLNKTLMYKINLNKANLGSANLKEANLRGVNFSGANLQYAIMHRASLNFANMRKAILRYAELCKARLGKADLSGADLYYADLSRASLGEANLSEAKLMIANMSEANLWAANLSKTDLTQTNLNMANLEKATLEGTILSGANLSHAEVNDEQLAYAILSNLEHGKAIMPDGTEYNDAWEARLKAIREQQPQPPAEES